MIFFWLPFGASKGLFLGVPLLLVLGRTLAIWLYMILSSYRWYLAPLKKKTHENSCFNGASPSTDKRTNRFVGSTLSFLTWWDEFWPSQNNNKIGSNNSKIFLNLLKIYLEKVKQWNIFWQIAIWMVVYHGRIRRNSPKKRIQAFQ